MKKREYFICAAIVIAAFYSLYSHHSGSKQGYDYSAAVRAPVIPTAEPVEENDTQSTFDGTLITDHSYDQQFLYKDGYNADSAYAACLVLYQQYGFQSGTNCEYVMEKNENGDEVPVGVQFIYIGDRP